MTSLLRAGCLLFPKQLDRAITDGGKKNYHQIPDKAFTRFAAGIHSLIQLLTCQVHGCIPPQAPLSKADHCNLDFSYMLIISYFHCTWWKTVLKINFNYNNCIFLKYRTLCVELLDPPCWWTLMKILIYNKCHGAWWTIVLKKSCMIVVRRLMHIAIHL